MTGTAAGQARVITAWTGDWEVVHLQVGPLEVEVVPQLSMLGAAVRLDGRDHVVLRPDLAAYAAGHWTGVPLLHPWANRLAGDEVPVPGTDVVLDLAGDPLVGRDEQGRPIHGTVTGLGGWEVTSMAADPAAGRASVEAVLHHDRRPELARAFPFPHRVVVRWDALAPDHPEAAGEATARVSTTVEATADVAVPVAFGWHPYLCVPGAPRAAWRLVLPDRDHLHLDGRGLPTGEVVREQAEAEPLGQRSFDDAYRLVGDRTMALEAGPHRTAVVAGEGFGWAQVFAPPGLDEVCLEPMTAPVNGLATGEHPWARPGEPVSATFLLQVR